MYAVHHRRSLCSRDDFSVVLYRTPSLVEAARARFVSGDLVVEFGSNRVVRSLDWLFEWEKLDVSCYAQRAIMDLEA